MLSSSIAVDIAMRRSFHAAIVSPLWCLCANFDIHSSLQSPTQGLPSPKHCQQHHRQITMSFQPVWVAFGPNPNDCRHIEPIFVYKTNKQCNTNVCEAIAWNRQWKTIYFTCSYAHWLIESNIFFLNFSQNQKRVKSVNSPTFPTVANLLLSLFHFSCSKSHGLFFVMLIKY